MSAHTPGPWWVDADGTDGDGVPVIRNFRAGSGNTQWGIGTVWHHSGGAMDDSETAANARLIASAPDLLEALQYAFKHAPKSFYLDGKSTPAEWIGKAEAALKKAGAL